MSGKTAGQLLHESLCETAVTEFDMPIEAFDTWDQMRESQRKRMETAAAAVETGQLRLAREDRDQLRKRVLDLAVRLEDDAATDARIAETHPNGTSSLLLEERAEAKRHAADQLRHAAGPPS